MMSTPRTYTAFSKQRVICRRRPLARLLLLRRRHGLPPRASGVIVVRAVCRTRSAGATPVL
ncbi:hypothetical protein [Streptosporangium vulgare]|uniref:hypothetical protein n=1 Tax=Streptosporangium vulgare TaxID=46190 RepID=UPI003CD0BF19